MLRLLGTFHKAGTVLWANILKEARARGLLQFWHMNHEPQPESWDIAFDYHSTALFSMLTECNGAARAVFCVRDPRDIIVSGAYYHQTSSESWLHVPRDDLAGMTYQQKLLSLPDMQARFQFEMKMTGMGTIQAMMNIPVKSPNVTITRMETLVEDVNLVEFDRVFRFLQFESSKALALKSVANNNSLFSGRKVASRHVRSGKREQYVTEFSAETLEMYDALFKGSAEYLGYDSAPHS